MQNKLPSNFFPKLPRVAQITNSHCGPAVLEMLLGNLGVKITQDQVVEAAHLSIKKLNKDGMTVEEMAVAAAALEPDVQFWMKNNATLPELRQIMIDYKYPVGVEWQGEFLQYADDETGHYAIVTNIDDWDGTITLADPFKPFSKKDRTLTLTRFEELWWDENKVRDLVRDKMVNVKDYHMIFIITPKKESFPRELKMVRG